jgi:hypothetical protein
MSKQLMGCHEPRRFINEKQHRDGVWAYLEMTNVNLNRVPQCFTAMQRHPLVWDWKFDFLAVLTSVFFS